MIRRVISRAHSNIALIKYWGKRSGEGNLPATPSISLGLRELTTETEIQKQTSGKDKIIINNTAASGESYKNLVRYLDYCRETGLISGPLRITSNNNFPTQAGLASSASGYAALATALSGFSEKKLSLTKLSHLARKGSGSAARSITGGLSAFPTGNNPAARLLLAPEKIPWGMVVVVVDSQSKAISSREGMEHSRLTSPYYKNWIKQADADYKSMLKAINTEDFTAIGELSEANALAMHCCMIASRPSLIYWNNTTVDIINSVKGWRKDGLEVYFTIDAGPNVILMGNKEDLAKIAQRAERVKGVTTVIPSIPGGQAEILLRE
ncbi:MAG: diphosphomevalonate decarboxylase [candidate division Zixibacteria bacterium]|nr:diphosphomevalonate decarboxylase [candidate division Zixibacteria bacterium]